MYQQSKKVAETMYLTALHNAAIAAEDNDDSAFRRICIYYACDKMGINLNACLYEKMVQASELGHKLADILIAGKAKTEDSELIKDMSTRAAISQNAITMANEFKITEPVAIAIFELVARSIKKIEQKNA